MWKFPGGTPERLTTIALLSAAAFTALYVLTSLTLPFGWDQGIMASVGSSYVHGKLPYSDSWDMKGPISYLPYSLAEVLFGPTMWGVRVLDAIFSLVASFVIYKVVRNLTNVHIAATAAFGIFFWVASGGWFFTAAPESWAADLGLLAVAPLLHPDRTPDARRIALSGLLVGCIGLIKPTYLPLGIAPLLAIGFAPGLTLWARTRLAIILGLSSALPVALAIGYFAWFGGLSQAIEVHLLYALSAYAGAPTGTNPIDGFGAFIARPVVAVITPFAVIGVWALRRRPTLLWPLVGWLAAMVVSVVAQGKYYYYQWVPSYAPLVVLAAVGAHAVVSADTRRGAASLLTLAAAMTFIVEVCAQPLHDAAKAVYYLGLKRAPDLYYASFSFRPEDNPLERTYNAGDEVAAARYIAAHTAPDDSVFVWGNDATVPYLANRPNPSRFSFEMPLSLPGSFRDRYRAEAIQALKEHPPTYIVVGINWWASDTKAQSLEKFPEMLSFLNSGYALEKTIGVLDLYRRVDRDRVLLMQAGGPAPDGAPQAGAGPDR